MMEETRRPHFPQHTRASISHPRPAHFPQHTQASTHSPVHLLAPRATTAATSAPDVAVHDSSSVWPGLLRGVPWSQTVPFSGGC